MKLQAPKGTKDILPSEIYRWHKARKGFHDVCHSFGYEEISIPTFEERVQLVSFEALSRTE